MKLHIVGIFSLFLGLAIARQYDGYTVYRVIPQSEKDLEIMRILNKDFEYDMWKECRGVGEPCDVMLAPDQIEYVQNLLEDNDVMYQVMMPDVGQVIFEQHQQRLASHVQDKVSLQNFDYSQYYPLAGINQWMEDMVTEHGNLIQSINVGTSHEGRPITTLKLTTGGTNKPVIWLDGGIHAREWISPATMMFFVNELVTRYNDRDGEVTALLNEADIYILPVINVDGYEYTWTNARLWRKTRSFNPDRPTCYGADPNRNWDVEWNTAGTSTNACSDLFAGRFAFSEVESKQVADFVAKLGNVVTFLSYHNYGEMYMTPYGYTNNPPADFDDLKAACDESLPSLTAVHNKVYRCDTLINLVGANSGSSVDYAYGVLGIKYSYGVELRDRGLHGFTLPPDQIIPTGEENFAFLMTFTRHVLDRQ